MERNVLCKPPQRGRVQWSGSRQNITHPHYHLISNADSENPSPSEHVYLRGPVDWDFSVDFFLRQIFLTSCPSVILDCKMKKRPLSIVTYVANCSIIVVLLISSSPNIPQLATQVIIRVTTLLIKQLVKAMFSILSHCLVIFTSSEREPFPVLSASNCASCSFAKDANILMLLMQYM